VGICGRSSTLVTPVQLCRRSPTLVRDALVWVCDDANALAWVCERFCEAGVTLGMLRGRSNGLAKCGDFG